MSKRIILCGHAACGKDFARKTFEKRGFKYAVSYTTRPPRVGEVMGEDYYFITNDKFKSMILNKEWYEYISFNDGKWLYGTSNNQFFKDDIFIMTPSGIEKIKEEDRKNTIVIFFDIPENIRRERLLSREMPGDTIERRLESDKKDFKDFTDYDIRITNEKF